MNTLSPSQNALRAVALAGLLFVIILLVLPQVKPPPGLWGVALWNLLHFPTFLAITLMLGVLFPDRFSEAKRALFLILIGSIIAVGSEIVQHMTGRSASLRDLMLDGAGIAFGLALLHGKGRWSRLGWSLCFVSLLGVFLILLWPTIEIARSVKRHRKLLPDIGGFFHPDSSLLWKTQGTTDARLAEDGSGLKIVIGRGEYGGVSYRPGLQDWSAFEELILKVRNEGEPFVLGIRVDDENSKSGEAGTWYSTESDVPSGMSEIRISLESIRNASGGSAIDLSRVVRLALFTGKESTGREFVLNSAFLR